MYMYGIPTSVSVSSLYFRLGFTYNILFEFIVYLYWFNSVHWFAIFSGLPVLVYPVN